ncbi:hypothetical protein OIU77_005888 [Salix suchowensis]|uniref:Thaumatin-like protein n=1 Tax=Salix suchowensis TaxID=1278906 RepID=A0ABQ9ASL1_9ROSI|nr:hypothetical protein OIU78_023962 [Salix suchowensis]KAJ6355390.1 hypothetical protein OIU77_005888 [Salix suchowensis]
MAYFSYFSLLPCFLLLAHFITLSNAATFEVRNQCPYTVWAAAVPGGGRRLDRGQSWTISVGAGTKQARIWGRTNCNFDGAGRGRCQTGDCNGLLQCQAFGQPPNTLAEYALNQFNNMDFYVISLADGFNVPMDFSPVSCKCCGMRCAADINGQCPKQLRSPGGCMISTAVILATVPPQFSLSFSRIGALTLIVILKMTKQAPSLVPVGLITGLCSALEAVLSHDFNGVK